MTGQPSGWGGGRFYLGGTGAGATREVPQLGCSGWSPSATALLCYNAGILFLCTVGPLTTTALTTTALTTTTARSSHTGTVSSNTRATANTDTNFTGTAQLSVG